MNAMPTILLVDPILGDRGLKGLAAALAGVVEVAETCMSHTSLPSALAADVTERLKADSRSWDWAVSVRDGAGIAAQMIARGQARGAVLIDPLTGIPELPGIAEALMQASPKVTPKELLRVSEVMATVTESHVPEEYLEIIAEGLFGGDPGVKRWEALYGEAYTSRMPLDPQRERQPQWWADEWVDVWRVQPDVVRPWFSERHRGLAEALSASTGLAVTVQNWSELTWLTDPAAVAAALNRLFDVG